MDVTLVVTVLREVEANTVAVVRPFETKALPRIVRVAPPWAGVVPIPRLEVAVRVVVLIEVVLSDVVAKTFVAVKVFEKNALPNTYMVVPEGTVVLTPTKPKVPKIDVTLAVAVLSDVVAKTLGAVMAFEMKAFPTMARVAPLWAGVVPIPMFEVAVIVKALRVVVLRVVMKILGELNKFETYTLPAM
jgi:hypothetical protein